MDFLGVITAGPFGVWFLPLSYSLGPRATPMTSSAGSALQSLMTGARLGWILWRLRHHGHEVTLLRVGFRSPQEAEIILGQNTRLAPTRMDLRAFFSLHLGPEVVTRSPVQRGMRPCLGVSDYMHTFWRP